MTAVTYLTRHRRPGIVILCSIVAVLSMLFVLPPAIASAADSGAQAVDECNPTASNGCVNGILQDADKKPIADVTITLSGKATAETKTAASGINVDQVVRVVWILSCAMAALSGVLLGVYLNGISWNTGATLILLMFAAVTLGGLGTANGALIGSLVIGIVADMSSLVIPNDMRYASALAILIIVLLVRPQGIFGKQQRVG